MKIYYPLRGNPRMTGKWGARKSFFVKPPGVWTLPWHYGVDWAVKTGTPIYAAMAGKVTKSSWDWSGYGGGNEVAVSSGKYRTWYLHLVRPSHLKVGSTVRVGDLIGYAGSTGLSTGPHLHFEFHINGSAVDPERFLTHPPKPKPKPTPVPEIIPRKGNEMFMIYLKDGGRKKGDHLFALVGPNFWMEFVGQDAANNLVSQVTNSARSLEVSKAFWDHCKAAATKGTANR